MKTLVTLMSLLVTLAQGTASANPISKSCEDYNQTSVTLLDKLLADVSSVSQKDQELQIANYQGMTEDSKACEVKISRVVRTQCGILSARYDVAIVVDSQDTNERGCAGALTMDVDLKINTEDQLEYKNTNVYPQLFATDFAKIAGNSENEGIKFTCHSHIKDRPGYRVGQDRKNNCLIR